MQYNRICRAQKLRNGSHVNAIGGEDYYLPNPQKIGKIFFRQISCKIRAFCWYFIHIFFPKVDWAELLTPWYVPTHSDNQWRTQNFRMGGVEVPQASRGVENGERVSPSLLGAPENFSYFLLKIPYFDAFWHVYFLNHTPMGGVLSSNPLTPSSVRHWRQSTSGWTEQDYFLSNHQQPQQ